MPRLTYSTNFFAMHSHDWGHVAHRKGRHAHMFGVSFVIEGEIDRDTDMVIAYGQLMELK